MTLETFRAEPIEVHLDRDMLVVSYVVKFKHSTIRIRPENVIYPLFLSPITNGKIQFIVKLRNFYLKILLNQKVSA